MCRSVFRIAEAVGLLFLTIGLAACGGGGTGAVGEDGRDGTAGTLTVRLTDAATDQFQAIYVTIAAVQVIEAAAPEMETTLFWNRLRAAARCPEP